METTQSNLFELQIDELSNSYLKETAKWAKFLSILGFIGCGLIVLIGLGMTFLFSSFNSPELAGPVGMYSSGLSLVYIALAALYFFPCLYLYRFAAGMQAALQAGEPVQLQTSFRNLKSCFRFIGILTIILMSIYLLAIVGVAIIGFASF
ncbi:MAG: DUF5362 family protein [Flavihumibacter sp.]|jgi:hypothetical protein|nr:DUF5362 family protein [Flavihumibacter sp.]